jgi:hypothetical protein
VFIPVTALRLRRIGWLIVALSPASILANTLGAALLACWKTGDELEISIGIDSTDIYAIVIGLLLAVVSRIMLEAIRIYDENGAFV